MTDAPTFREYDSDRDEEALIALLTSETWALRAVAWSGLSRTRGRRSAPESFLWVGLSDRSQLRLRLGGRLGLRGRRLGSRHRRCFCFEADLWQPLEP